MDNPAATLYCSNIRCQAPNPQSNNFCQQCRTPLLRRYLWAVSQGLEADQLGEVLVDRYVLVCQRILLDTKPGIPPETPLEIPPSMTPYLRLSPYRLHIPQVYGRLMPAQGRGNPEIWLLEDAPIYYGNSRSGTKVAQLQGQLLPELSSIWQNAPALRQLNWLWQLASLWQPLSSEGVASSLLTTELLRVEGSLVRLLELKPDISQAPTLQQLGQLWSQWLSGASPGIAGFCQQLCSQLVAGQIRTSEQLVGLLDQGLKDCGRSQSRRYQIFTCSDTGPSRSHNEDACYPPSRQLVSPPTGTNALAIVCDGIGGHEGGEVASNLAIAKLREEVEKLPDEPDNWHPITLTLELERATCEANDTISQQNDHEHRCDRQRMGTTLVMARTCAHEMYITHVGDSRVYWITGSNCHQVTQDDDLASREVRLGYTLYRNAVQQPTSGSLVQALGMASSANLHPTVQRFILDEDCVFLLCSDGLSDHDRVEQHWQTEILPILEGQIDLTTAANRLIQIANIQNGHDNATLAMVYCQVTPLGETEQPELSLPQLESLPTPVTSRVSTMIVPTASSQMKTQQLSSTPATQRPWGLLMGIFILLGLSGVLAYLLIPGVSESVNPLLKQISANPSPSPEPLPPSPSPPNSPGQSSSGVSSLKESTLIRVENLTPKNSQGKPVQLLLHRGLPPQNSSVVGAIPAGSLLQVLSKSSDQQQQSWVQLRVCGTSFSKEEAQPPHSGKIPAQRPQPGKSPTVSKSQQTSDTNRQVEPGDGGWIKEADVLPLIDPNFTPTSTQRQECVIPNPG